MSEPIECPYCSNIIQRQAMPYNETVKIQCPHCGGSFDYVPGFGTMTERGPSSDGAAIEADRPAPPPTPTPTPRRSYQDPIFKDGRAYDDPFAPGKKPSKPFEPGKECTRACGITIALCAICFALMFLMMGIMLASFPYSPYYP